MHSLLAFVQEYHLLWERRRRWPIARRADNCLPLAWLFHIVLLGRVSVETHLLYWLYKCCFWRMNIWLMQRERSDEEAVSGRRVASLSSGWQRASTEEELLLYPLTCSSISSPTLLSYLHFPSSSWPVICPLSLAVSFPASVPWDSLLLLICDFVSSLPSLKLQSTQPQGAFVGFPKRWKKNSCLKGMWGVYGGLWVSCSLMTKIAADTRNQSVLHWL